MAPSARNAGSAPDDELLAQLAASQRQAALMTSAHYQAADQFARLCLSGVALWCDYAGDVKRPDHLLYRQLLQQWVRVMDMARARAAGIEVPGDGCDRLKGPGL